jgi:hypothetical protein
MRGVEKGGTVGFIGHRALLAFCATGFLVPGVASGESSDLRTPLRARRITCVWVDIASRVPFVFDAMTAEVRSILEPLGVEAVWKRGQPGQPTRDEVNVILLNSNGSGTGLEPHVLGAVMQGGATAVWVYLPNVVWALGMNQGDELSWSARERQGVARALGRVVAHELVHALDPELPHGPAGLMSPTFNRKSLLASRLDLDHSSRDALRSGLEARDRELSSP